MVKKPSQQAIKAKATPEQAAALADKLADKPYGDNENPPAARVAEPQTRASISLPTALLRQIEDKALENKRNGIEPKSVSALIREALMLYM